MRFISASFEWSIIAATLRFPIPYLAAGISTPMLPDIDKYMPYLDELALSDTAKAELIRTVWAFAESYGDQAFDLHPSQQIRGYHADFNLQSQGGFLDSKVIKKESN